MKITAAVLDQIGQPAPYAETRPLRIAEIDLAPPLPGEPLVRIEAAGLCHSDLSVINGDRPRPMPMAIGHEAVATVIAVGDPEAGGLVEGDRVVLSFLPACGRCPACAAGEGYMCAVGAAANGEGWLPVEKLLTSVSPPAEINGLLDELASGRAIRQIVIPDAPGA